LVVDGGGEGDAAQEGGEESEFHLFFLPGYFRRVDGRAWVVVVW
jgi:hypothetical protein